MKWEMVPAERFCDSVRDGTHDTPKPTEAGFFLVTSRAVKNNSIDFCSCYYISEKRRSREQRPPASGEAGQLLIPWWTGGTEEERGTKEKPLA